MKNTANSKNEIVVNKKEKQVSSTDDGSGNDELKGFIGKFLTKSEIKNLLLIIALGLILRLAFIIETAGTPFVKNLLSDSKIYNDWALAIAGKGASGNYDGVFFMAPVYPYFLGIIYKLFGQVENLVRILQAVISAANIFIIYLTGRKLLNKNTGYLAAVIAAFYKMFIFYSGSILSETLQTFFISCFILQLVSAFKDKKETKWFWTGILLGICALFRANILLFVPFVLIWFILRIRKDNDIKRFAYRSVLFLAIGTFLPILPVTVRNYAAGNDLVMLTSNGGINFYLGNNPNSPGVFQAPDEFDIYSDLSGQKYAEKMTNRKVKASEASSYWYDKGLEYVTGDPGGAIALSIKKIFLFWGAEENPQSVVMDPDYFARNYSKVLQLPLFSFLFVALLSVTGMILGWKERDKFSLLYLFIAAYTLASIVFFVNGRFRLALTPVLLIFASYAIIKIYEILKSKEYNLLKVPAAVVSIFIIITTFLVAKPVFNEYDAYLSLGNIYFDQKEYDKAIESFGKSLIYRDNYITYVNIANSYAAKKDFRSALGAYQKAINRNPNYPLAYFNIGLIHSEAGNLQMAEKAYKKTIDLDPKFADAYRNLGIVYYIQQNYAMSYENFEKYLQYSQDEAIKTSVMKDMENIKRYLKK